MKLKIMVLLILIFTLLPQTEVFAEDNNTTITPSSRNEMINSINSIFGENLRAQKNEFSITIEGDFLKNYYTLIVNNGDLSFEPDEPYFSVDAPLNKFKSTDGNDYYSLILESISISIVNNPEVAEPLKWIKITYTVKWKEALSATQAVKDHVKGINNSILNSSMSNYQKVKAIHDYLIDTYDYDTSFGDNPPSNLINSRVYTCDNITALFYVMLKDAGIDSRIVLLDSNYQPSMGEASANNWAAHAWNMAYVDGKWYHIDLTWDENVPKEKYRYFLKSSSTFKSDHRWDTSLYLTAASDYSGGTVASPSSSKATVSSSSSEAVSSEITSSENISSDEGMLTTFSSSSQSNQNESKSQSPVALVIAIISVSAVSASGILVYLLKFKGLH